jgi:hypothetical protein
MSFVHPVWYIHKCQYNTPAYTLASARTCSHVSILQFAGEEKYLMELLERNAYAVPACMLGSLIHTVRTLDMKCTEKALPLSREAKH